MAEATLQRVGCENCGVDVRENTHFCYNCGKPYSDAARDLNGLETAALSEETQTALDDLAAKLRTEEADGGDKLAIAAAKRKKARVSSKRSAEVIWEPDNTSSGLFIFIVSLIIFLLVAAVVFFTVYWK